MAQDLYNQDFQLWIDQTIHQLQQHEFSALDIEHLIEELADLGKSEKNALKSNLSILLAHLLKLKVQAEAPDSMKSSWYSSVDEHRQRINNALIETPSLRSFLPEAIDKSYLDGRKLAIKEGKRAAKGVALPNENEYPIVCPFTLEQILDDEFYG